jgi:hypothetical protein
MHDGAQPVGVLHPWCCHAAESFRENRLRAARIVTAPSTDPHA